MSGSDRTWQEASTITCEDLNWRGEWGVNPYQVRISVNGRLTHMFNVSNLDLTNPDGSAVDLADFAGKPLVVQLLRYWG